MGRLLDELDDLWFEDPILTTDVDGLVQLATALDVPLHLGEFLASISDFAEYIRRGAVDVVRLNVFDLAVHFHLELALPNAHWFEMPFPPECTDRPYHRDRFRIDAEGYVHSPTAPGLGYPLDRDVLDRMTKRIEV